MIVIFANRFDESSYLLARRWSEQNALVLTCNDLSITGWRNYLPFSDRSRAVIDGCVVPVKDINGVLIRWPGVFEPELSHIAAEDRDYVAREMMSFLVAWFSSLECPVINQPTPVSLTGPAWRVEHWIHAAATLGIPVKRTECHVTLDDGGAQTDESTPETDVTVIGNRCFGDVEEPLREQARKLARAAEVTLLKVSFNQPLAGATFLGADLLPTLTDEMADAVLENLLSSGAISF